MIVRVVRMGRPSSVQRVHLVTCTPVSSRADWLLSLHWSKTEAARPDKLHSFRMHTWLGPRPSRQDPQARSQPGNTLSKPMLPPWHGARVFVRVGSWRQQGLEVLVRQRVSPRNTDTCQGAIWVPKHHARPKQVLRERV